jgi:hypothetical protein
MVQSFIVSFFTQAPDQHESCQLDEAFGGHLNWRLHGTTSRRRPFRRLPGFGGGPSLLGEVSLKRLSAAPRPTPARAAPRLNYVF